MYKKIIEKLINKKIAILGFGKEGKSTYKFIRKYLPTKELFILDKNEMIEKINNQNTIFITGKNYLDDLESFDLIIKTPGISLNNKDITNIKDKITSQCNLLLENIDCKIIGITGTKGKSTTASLIYKIIKEQHENTYLCGNIGIPIFEYVDKFNKDTTVVVELSAYHTEFLKTSPTISIILNLFEEHLDYFKTKENYFNSKLNLFKYLDNHKIGIYSENNKTLKKYIEDNNYKNLIKIISTTDINTIEENTIAYNEEKIYIKRNNKLKELYNENEKRNLLGKHNLENIMFALAISELLNLDIIKTRKSIQEFKPLEHRMELVGTFNDIIFYNDSIATIPSATINCIETLKKVNSLIIGGMDRKIDYKEFIDYLKKSKIENIICLKDTGYIIGKKLEQNKKVLYAESMEEAVKYAYLYTKKDNICLLSPAASSYNYYKNFEEKGNEYKNIIKYLSK